MTEKNYYSHREQIKIKLYTEFQAIILGLKEKGITCEYPCKIAMQMVTSALGHMDDYYLKTYFTSEP